jgi:hypothetical protein
MFLSIFVLLMLEVVRLPPEERVASRGCRHEARRFDRQG